MATKLPGSVADHGVGNGQIEPSEDRLDDAQESEGQGAIEGPVASTILLRPTGFAGQVLL